MRVPLFKPQLYTGTWGILAMTTMMSGSGIEKLIPSKELTQSCLTFTAQILYVLIDYGVNAIYLLPRANRPDATISSTITNYMAPYDTGKCLLERLFRLCGKRRTVLLPATMPTNTIEVGLTGGSLSKRSRNTARCHLGLCL